MSQKRNPVQKLKVTKDFRDDTAGILYTILPPDSGKKGADDDSSFEEPQFAAVSDPVIPHNQDARRKPPKRPEERPRTEGTALNPSLSTRVEFHKHCYAKEKPDEVVKHDAPKPRPTKKRKQDEVEEKQKERQPKRERKDKEKQQKERHPKCEYTILRLPSPVNMMDLEALEMMSPELSKTAVMPAKPSLESGYLYPEPPTEDELALKKPKSGIFINVTKEERDSDESILADPTAKRARKLRSGPLEIEEEEEETVASEQWEEEYGEDFFYEEGEGPFLLDKWTAVDADAPLRMVRRPVKQSSKATSLDETDFVFEEKSWQRIPLVSQLVQTFRERGPDDQRRRRRRFRRGTLESHSYTRLRQRTLREVPARCVQGSIHQADENFSTVSRNRQGVCMPIAALCYAKSRRMRAPTDWTERCVDEVVDAGDALYVDSVSSAHMHRGSERRLTARDLRAFCLIGDARVPFEIDEPDVNGCARSTDRTIYNLTKGLTIFFNRHKRALFETDRLSLAIWRKRRFFYIFDANPRLKDASEDPSGKATVIVVESLRAVLTILLDRTDLANSPFLVSKVTVGGDRGDRADADRDGPYNVLSDRRAVVSGTFDLADRCFCFTRHKQALAMAVVSLVYARISRPSAWRRRTVDKIMVLGDLLYVECADAEGVADLALENVPAVFTVGPYVVEVRIYADCAVANLYKKGRCALPAALDAFLEANTSAIVQIGQETIAVWRQRGAVFCFDPYSRNGEGLKCRSGSACVSMGGDVAALAATLEANFDCADAIFRVHALKVVRIRRDPAAGRVFPRGVAMRDVPVEVLRGVRCRRGKRRAVERPVRADFAAYAVRKLLAGEEPAPSIADVASDIGSLNDEYLPPFEERPPPKEIIRTEVEERDIADLDSPALSETQLAPERPQPMGHEELLTLMDLDALEMTQEELEAMGAVEEEGEGEYGGGAFRKEPNVAGEEMMGEGEEDFYLVKSVYTSVNSSSLESMHLRRSEVINTDVSYCYNILPAQELPVRPKRYEKRRIVIDEEMQSNELTKESKFKARDNSYQILSGERNVAEFCTDLDRVAPYVCVMAVGYSNEQPLYKWTRKTIDFVVRGGCELYNRSEVPYESVGDFHLEFSRCKVDIVLESLLDTYVGSRMIESEFSERALQALLENYLFTRSVCGIVVTKRYSCAIFFKRHLLYMLEVFGCDADGRVTEGGLAGPACLMRFLSLEPLVARLLENRRARLPAEDDGAEYARIVLVKPTVRREGDDRLEHVAIQKFYDKEGALIEPEVAQSQELRKRSNFVDLPDGSQIVRGAADLRGLGVDEVDLLAPYVCIMAAAVAGKYSVGTWSPDIVNYVLQCGAELHRKSRYQFLEVAKLEIPRVALGRTDFGLEVNYQFDAPLKQRILEVALERVLQQNGDWTVVVAQEYSCSCYYKNGLYYLYDGYATNEVGLSEGPFAAGFASFSRFMDVRSMCGRIVYNKRKRELPEKVTYSRFVLSTCRVRYLRPESKPKARKSKRKIQTPPAETVRPEEDAAEEEEEEAAEEEEEGEKVQNKAGFQKRDAFWVIEGTRSLDGRAKVSYDLKADHFVCICACLTVINTPIRRWDTRRVNRVVGQGQHIYSHAENLEFSDKRTIKNILIGRHFFDIIIKPIKLDSFKKRLTVARGLNVIFTSFQRKFALVQFLNCCVVVYKEDDVYYLFDPYWWTYRTSDKETRRVEAGWTMYTDARRLANKTRSLMVKEGHGQFFFYSFEVISVRRAPRRVLMSHKAMQYKVDKAKPPEAAGKPFHEQENWLNVHQTPWSRISERTACGKFRCSRDSKWHSWDIEYPNDLFSLVGTLHMTSKRFGAANRGKQTLSNLVVAIAMTNIYELSEWTDRILDSILCNGDAYFAECARDIDERDHELAVEDLAEKCSIFPYNFKVSCAPAIEGTMFLTHRKKFNLYKALRYFFENYESRCGIVIAARGDAKRLCSFGKTQEGEYFMCDCQAMGPPMFFERDGASYALRCTTLARLLHCIVLTLKGGDFFIYDVETYDFESISAERDDAAAKKKKGEEGAKRG